MARLRDEDGRYLRQTMAERFPTLHQPDENGCWVWQGEITKAGYGRITDFWEKRLAHRYSWELHHARVIPDGMVVMHICDVRACVNPDHLRLGTQSENILDAIAKGRVKPMGPKNPRRGSANNKAKLTEDDIPVIRARYAAGGVTLEDIGADYGVSKTVIHKIVKRHTWQHV